MILSEDNKGKRLFLTLLLFAVGFYFLGRGIYAGLNHQGGWIEIEPQAGTVGCGSAFEFQYLLDDRNGNLEYRELTLTYTSLCTREEKLYSSTERDPELGNLAALNASPNRELRLEPELYRALEKVQAGGDRVLYLAPLYEYYGCLFFCEREEETLTYDPLRNPELAKSFGELASFANDPARVDVELLGDNMARLKVSEDYLDYAERNGISVFVDFGWMRNAFILDDMADALRAKGFLRGYIQSEDGFGCNLCDTGEGYSLNIFDRANSGGAVTAQMEYRRPITFLSLHSYTVTPAQNDSYFELADGQVRSIFVDPADGMPKTAMDDLLLWSDTLSCGELVLQAQRVFVTGQPALSLTADADYFFAYCRDGTLYCSDPSVSFPIVAEGYRLRQAGAGTED